MNLILPKGQNSNVLRRINNCAWVEIKNLHIMPVFDIGSDGDNDE